MDMSKHPQAQVAEQAHDPHGDWSNPGETWAILLAVAWIAALVIAFAIGGLAGVAAVKVTLVPVIMIALALITVGR